MAEHFTGITPALLTKEQAAAYLSVSPATIDRLTARGRLPVMKMPGTGNAGRPRNMYARAALDRFIDQHTRYVCGEERDAAPSRRRKQRSPYRSAMEALKEAEGQR